MKKALLLAAAGTAGMIFSSAGEAAQIITRKDVSGIPQVLTGNPASGYTPLAHGWISVTLDGYVVAANFGAGGGKQHYILNPSLEIANNATGNSQAAFMRYYSTGQDLKSGSVGSGAGLSNTGLTAAGFTRQTIGNTAFGTNTAGAMTLGEFQYQDGSSVYDADSGKGAQLSNSPGLAIYTSQFKDDLELIESPGSDVHRLITGLASSGADNVPVNHADGIAKLEIGARTGHDSTTVGTRTGTQGGKLIGGSLGTAASLLDDLVPSIADKVYGFGYNTNDNNLYLVSNDTTNNKAYVSAISFAWGTTVGNSTATYVDLDPDTANTYKEITYDSGDAFPDLKFAKDVAFSPDGSQMYVSNYGTRVFIFDVVVPEPASVGVLMSLGMMGLLARRRRTA